MIIHITRKFPPSIGGMQRFNKKLSTELKFLTELELIAWGGSQTWLPFFVGFAFLKTCIICLTRPVSSIYLGDGVLAPLGAILKWLTGKPVIVTLHGSDVVYPHPVYQKILRWALPKMDHIVCVSAYLKSECLIRGAPDSIVTVIPNGVTPDDFQTFETKSDLRSQYEKKYSISLRNRKIILTVGRLISKKGVLQFIQQILPELKRKYPDILYLIVGDGPLRGMMEKTIHHLKLESHVLLLGSISMEGDQLKNIYYMADIFVMPNICSEQGMEGFGIVALEACCAKLPVVSYDVGGVRQAIHHGQNGFLVLKSDIDSMIDVISQLIDNPQQRSDVGLSAYDYVVKNFSWQNITLEYQKIFHSISQNTHK